MGSSGLFDVGEVVLSIAELALFVDAEAQGVLDKQRGQDAAKVSAAQTGNDCTAPVDDAVGNATAYMARATASEIPAPAAPVAMDDPNAGQSMLDAFLTKPEP